MLPTVGPPRAGCSVHDIPFTLFIPITMYDLVVGIGLGQILLQESQVLVGRLSSFGGSGSLGLGGRCGERGLLGIEFRELGSEVRWEGGGLGRGGGLVASNAGRCVGGLIVSLVWSSSPATDAGINDTWKGNWQDGACCMWEVVPN